MEPEILPHILFFKGNIKTYKEALDFEKKDVPYFFVLDPDGKIVHATSGKFTEKKMDAVERVIEDWAAVGTDVIILWHIEDRKKILSSKLWGENRIWDNEGHRRPWFSH